MHKWVRKIEADEAAEKITEKELGRKEENGETVHK